MDLKYLNVLESDLISYDLTRVYSKHEICIFANRIYISNCEDNVGDNPYTGLKWDQLI